MKFMMVGDVHIADRGPSLRTDDYRSQIEDKLRWIVEISNDLGVDAIVQLGDFFHIKQANRNSHEMVRSSAEILERSNSPVRIIVGNHDVQYSSLDSIPSQPLGTLALHPKIDILIGPDKEFPLWGQPYFDLSPENFQYWVDRYHEDKGPEEYPVLLAHQSIFPEKERPPYDAVSSEQYSESFQAPYVAYGHIHHPMSAGWNYKSGNTWFLNNGAISRGSLAEHSLKRKPSVTIFDLDNPEDPFTSLEVPHVAPDVAFRLDIHEKQLLSQGNVDDFLASLGTADLGFTTVESILSEARTEKTLTKSALEELESIIEEVV